jgi:hypothetical protein
MKRFAFAVLLAVMVAVDYFAAEYYKPIAKVVMGHSTKGKR